MLAGALAGDEQSARVVAVGAGHAAGDEHVALVEVVDDAGLDGLVALDRSGRLTAPQAILSCTSGVSTIKRSLGERPVRSPRLDHQRAVGCHAAFFAADSVLDELRGG